MLCWHGLYGLAHTGLNLDGTSKISFLRSSYVQYLSLDTAGNVGKCHHHSRIGKTPRYTVIHCEVHQLSRYLLYGTEIRSEYKNFFSEAQLRPKAFI